VGGELVLGSPVAEPEQRQDPLSDLVVVGAARLRQDRLAVRDQPQREVAVGHVQARPRVPLEVARLGAEVAGDEAHRLGRLVPAVADVR